MRLRNHTNANAKLLSCEAFSPDADKLLVTSSDGLQPSSFLCRTKNNCCIMLHCLIIQQ